MNLFVDAGKNGLGDHADKGGGAARKYGVFALRWLLRAAECGIRVAEQVGGSPRLMPRNPEKDIS